MSRSSASRRRRWWPNSVSSAARSDHALAASVLGMSLGADGHRAHRRPLRAAPRLAGQHGGVRRHRPCWPPPPTDVASLAAWRFLDRTRPGCRVAQCGRAHGGIRARAAAQPAHRAISLLGVPIGGILGSALAAELVPEYGWRAIFIAGGCDAPDRGGGAARRCCRNHRASSRRARAAALHRRPSLRVPRRLRAGPGARHLDAWPWPSSPT